MLNNAIFELIYKGIVSQTYKPSTLFVVGLPIGNMGDVTLRALHVLSICDRIAAENVHYSRMLLTRYHLNKPMISLNEHNEIENSVKIIKHLGDGERIVLITDAGTPGISDPGSVAVSIVRDRGFNVVPIPGPSAFVTAMSILGWAPSSFTFHGFLPRNKIERERFLFDISKQKPIHVFYEAPHRIVAMLSSCLKCFGGDRKVLLVKELTKIYEATFTGKLSQILQLVDCEKQRGEFVVVIEGLKSDLGIDENVGDDLLKILLQELPLSQSVRLASKITGREKNVLYKKALSLKESC